MQCAVYCNQNTKLNEDLTVSISCSLLSFFSMVRWADCFLLSYILVPAASSIMDKIYKQDQHFYSVIQGCHLDFKLLGICNT